MTVVVKYGGAAMTDPGARAAFGADIENLRDNGARVVVVHGGGPQITSALDALGVESVFANGRRVTTPETMAVVRGVLAGEVNAEVVAAVGPYATGVSGEDVLTAEPLDPALGLVGEVTAVDTAAINALLDQGRVPCVATIATGTDGTRYNVNADTAAAAIAVALGAEEAVFLTDVRGLYAAYPDPASLVARIAADEAEALLPRLTDGMVPKVEACLRAVRGGVPHARIADGRVPHALLRDDGTTVTP
ncbi:MAG TPA: acetylglutamate kinase [Frankiaceae bacterium]|nr:acetylglutamate kinase [Frankiaceae bacterium]